MMANLKYWLKGLAVAALSMVVYAGALGCYIALMLLVISMEEGGDNLSAFSVSLTEAVVLLSQGNGFKTGSITLTIMPLLLTVLLIALIASLAKRVGTSLSGCVAGTIGWVLINVFFANSLDIKLVDTTGRGCCENSDRLCTWLCHCRDSRITTDQTRFGLDQRACFVSGP